MAKKKSKKTSPPPEPTGAAPSPREEARRLLEEADFADPAEQASLARQALQLDPDLAEAYLLLGRINPLRREALALYQQALAAAERTVGEEDLRRYAGRMDEHPKGPVLVEAHLALAHLCWALGRRGDAIHHGREMLRLEPRDPHQMRYTLAGWLLAQDRDAETAQLIEQYPEDSTVWNYTRALLTFRREGDSERARKLLKKGRKSNKYVPRYLLQETMPGAEPPDSYLPGSSEEAEQYLASFLASWRAAEGAIDWLRQHTRRRKDQSPEPRAVGPTRISKRSLERLPQHSAVWQVDCRRLATWVQEGGRDLRPWIVLVSDEESSMIVGNDMLFEQASADQVWDVLARSMRQPAAESGFAPGRPAEIVYPAGQPWQALEEHFRELGIAFQPRDHLETLGDLFQVINQEMGGQPEPGLLDVPGVTPELVQHCYEAAAEFYRQAPWRLVGYESAVEVRCSKFQSGPWYAVVMGQSGMSLGVALYDNLKLLRRLWSEPGSARDNARRSVATTVTFGPAIDVPIPDVDAAQQHGWPVARADAYPHVFHKDRGLTTRPPLAWELELLEACLRALPDFIRRRPQDDTTPEEVTVPAGNGQLTLTLAWIEDEAPRPSRKRKRRSRRGEEPDPYVAGLLQMLQDHWPAIRKAHDEFGDQKPILLFRVQEEEIEAYSYEDFHSRLDPEGQAQLEAQYQQAIQDDDVVIFVADYERGRVEAFSLNLG